MRPPARSLQAKNYKLGFVWNGTLPGTKITLKLKLLLLLLFLLLVAFKPRYCHCWCFDKEKWIWSVRQLYVNNLPQFYSIKSGGPAGCETRSLGSTDWLDTTRLTEPHLFISVGQCVYVYVIHGVYIYIYLFIYSLINKHACC